MKKDILLINGVPRSGTSAIGSILGAGEDCAYRFQPLYSYQFRDRAKQYSGASGILKLADELLACEDSFIRNGMVDARLTLSELDEVNTMVIKHVRYHENLSGWLENSNVKLLCVIRDPRACIYSQISIRKEWKGSLNEFPDWINAPHINHKGFEYFGFSGWLRFCFMAEMLKLCYPEKVNILKYEDFAKDNNMALSQVVDELQLSLMLKPVKQNKKLPNAAYSVTSRSEKDWRKSLSMDIRNTIESVCLQLNKEGYLCD